MILRNSVSVSRMIPGVVSQTGVKNDVLTVITSSMNAMIQPAKGDVIQPIQGQTALSYKTMFCYVTDIKPNDIITDLSTSEKFKVINVNQFNILKHMEITLEGGVV